MSQNDNRDTDPREDGVALSPYDDDLAPATEPPAPEAAPSEDLTPEFSDAPAEAEEFATPPPSHQPAWQRVRDEAPAAPVADQPDAPAVDEPIAEESPVAGGDRPSRLPFDETAARGSQPDDAWEPGQQTAGTPVVDDEPADAPAADTSPADDDVQYEGSIVADDTTAEPVQEFAAEPAEDLPADSLADETFDEDVQTSTYQVPEPDPVSDTAVRRTSLLRPAETEEELEAPAVVPVAGPLPDDDRASAYGPEDSDLFAGATYDKVPSRAGAHAWSLLTILLVPIAWYLLSDAGARMTLPDGAAWEIGTVNLAAIGELAAGLLLAFIIMLAARASSLGVLVTGILVSIIGGAFIVAPAWTKDFIEPVQDWLRGFNPGLGGNLAHHLEWDGATGRIFVVGIGLLFVAMVSHFARRRGRDEEKIRNAIALRRPKD